MWLRRPRGGVCFCLLNYQLTARNQKHFDPTFLLVPHLLSLYPVILSEGSATKGSNAVVERPRGCVFNYAVSGNSHEGFSVIPNCARDPCSYEKLRAQNPRFSLICSMPCGGLSSSLRMARQWGLVPIWRLPILAILAIFSLSPRLRGGFFLVQCLGSIYPITNLPIYQILHRRPQFNHLQRRFLPVMPPAHNQIAFVRLMPV
jgi:hypothetical protein